MLPSLPPELLELIVDHSAEEPTTLKTFCLVSKLWISRTRGHLFAHVEFDSRGPSIESWMETFPDPLNSPAHHTRSLNISDITTATAATTYGNAWIRSFHCIVSLMFGTRWWNGDDMSLVRLHGLSPTLKSLCMNSFSLLISEVSDLTCSFPLLENLSLDYSPPLRHDPMNPPPTSPKLTGSLVLKGETLSTARWLSGLPGGLHFVKITMDCRSLCLESTMNLVSRCSDTLEHLSFDCFISDPSTTPPFDLSNVTKLKDIEFRWRNYDIRWITESLQTAQSPNLQRITINSYRLCASPHPVTQWIGGWLALDRLLVQWRTSRPILLKVKCERERWYGLGQLAPSLLPELTRMGAVSAVW